MLVCFIGFVLFVLIIVLCVYVCLQLLYVLCLCLFLVCLGAGLSQPQTGSELVLEVVDLQMFCDLMYLGWGGVGVGLS